MGSAYDWSDYEDEIARDAWNTGGPGNMTDNRPFTPSEVDELDAELHGWPLIASLPRDEALRLMATLRAADRDLATARAATARVLPWVAGWEHLKLTDAERAWLASVSPTTSGEEP